MTQKYIHDDIDIDSAMQKELSLFTWEDALQQMQEGSDAEIDCKRHLAFLKSNLHEFSEHIHPYFEIIYVLSGTCSYSFNGQTINLNAGDFCLYPPELSTDNSKSQPA